MDAIPTKMNLQELQRFHEQVISYRIADKVGSGTLIIHMGKASITVSSSDDGLEDVEPIQLTVEQCGAIECKDGVLTLGA